MAELIPLPIGRSDLFFSVLQWFDIMNVISSVTGIHDPIDNDAIDIADSSVHIIINVVMGIPSMCILGFTVCSLLNKNSPFVYVLIISVVPL